MSKFDELEQGSCHSLISHEVMASVNDISNDGGTTYLRPLSITNKVFNRLNRQTEDYQQEEELYGQGIDKSIRNLALQHGSQSQAIIPFNVWRNNKTKKKAFHPRCLFGSNFQIAMTSNAASSSIRKNANDQCPMLRKLERYSFRKAQMRRPKRNGRVKHVSCNEKVMLS